MACSESVAKHSVQSLDEKIQLLSSIAESESPVLSCYLDLDSGWQSCLDSLEAVARNMRSDMSSTDRLDFDEAYALVKETLSAHHAYETRGLAIFARGILGGKFLCVVPSMLPFRQQLTYYPVPDVRPLLSLRESYGDQLLLWAVSDGIELLRFSEGRVQTLAWVAENGMQPVAPESQIESAPELGSALKRSRIANVAWRTLSRVLKSGHGLKLILAGDKRRLSRLWHGLPRPVRSQVADAVTLPHSLDRARAMRQFIDHAAVGCRVAVDAFASACLQAPFARRQCVTGAQETLSALRSQSLQTLFITSHSMLTLVAEQKQRFVVTGSGARPRQPWHVGIELSRLAVQQGVRTLVTDARELMARGGVGGVLDGSAETSVMPRPQVGSVTGMVA